MTHPNIVPTQDDREAAADVWRDFVARPGECIAEKTIRSGRMDECALVQAFARHRQTRPVGEDERAVAWLRACADEDRYGPRWRPLHYAASAIERGEHRDAALTPARTYKQGIEDALENWWANYPLTEADTAGSCRSPELCFQYNEWVRCGPCGIKHRDAIRALGTKDPKGPI